MEFADRLEWVWSLGTREHVSVFLKWNYTVEYMCWTVAFVSGCCLVEHPTAISDVSFELECLVHHSGIDEHSVMRLGSVLSHLKIRIPRLRITVYYLKILLILDTTCICTKFKILIVFVSKKTTLNTLSCCVLLMIAWGLYLGTFPGICNCYAAFDYQSVTFHPFSGTLHTIDGRLHRFLHYLCTEVIQSWSCAVIIVHLQNSSWEHRNCS